MVSDDDIEAIATAMVPAIAEAVAQQVLELVDNHQP